MAKKKPSIRAIGRSARQARETPGEDKTQWVRDLKKRDPELAAEVLSYIRDWLFKPASDARVDCKTRNDLRRVVQKTLDANKVKIGMEKTTFASLLARMERSYEQGR